MDTKTTTINCPNCGAVIDVNDIVYHKLEEELKNQFAQRETALRTELEEQQLLMTQKQLDLDDQEKLLSEKITDGVKTGLKKEKEALEQKIRTEIQDEQSEQMLSLKKQLDEKSEKVKELYQAQATIEQLKREKDEMKDQLTAEAQKTITDTIAEEKEKIKKTEEEKNAMKIADKEHVINQLKTQLQEAQRKIEQGSTQVQGEVQELAIEEWLQLTFPLDTIEEIKKGALGGDCLQVVNTRYQTNCGKIYYESKRTKDFSVRWVEKFKADMIAKGADIGVIVTEARPKDMDRLGQVDGVWIASFEEFKGLSQVLRETIIMLSTALVTQENKGDKMVMLYNYLTSPEFKLVLEAIMSGFEGMKLSLDRERRSMERLWKEREKQIEKVLFNTAGFYGSIKGIAGNDVPTLKLLELGGDGDDDQVDVVEEKNQ